MRIRRVLYTVVKGHSPVSSSSFSGCVCGGGPDRQSSSEGKGGEESEHHITPKHTNDMLSPEDEEEEEEEGEIDWTHHRFAHRRVL